MLKRIGLIVLVLGLLAQVSSAAPYAWVVQAYDLVATSYTYCVTDPPGSTPVCGTAITNGWIYIPPTRPTVAAITWVTKAATSLEYSVECRSWTGGIGQALGTGSLTAVGTNYLVILSNANVFDQCRIGLKLTTDTGTNSVTAYFGTK